MAMTRVQKALLSWYGRERRSLPWRQTRDPYHIFVSEIMLQQTQVSTVIPYYERFLKAFPTVKALANALQDRLMKAWEGLGYYARARHLKEAARQIVEEHHGLIPKTPAAFSNLPGAGPYTTAAVLSIAYGIPLAAVDGNVRRIIARLFDIGRPLKPNDEEIQARADGLLAKHRPGDFNQAMMELGARICTPKSPACPVCPVRFNCRAAKNGTVASRPVAAPRRARPHLRVVAAVLAKNGRILIGRRPARGLLGGLWEFPGGKIEKEESPRAALRRELREELGIEAEAGPAIAEIQHAYTHFSVTLSGHLCRLRRGTPKPRVHSALRWVTPKALERHAMPEANRKLIREMWEQLSGIIFKI